MKPVNIGLLGLGTVGCGMVEVLQRNAEDIARRAGRQVVIKLVAVRDLTKKRDCSVEKLTLIDDPQRVVMDEDIRIVVELIGGVERAKQLVLTAIEQVTLMSVLAMV